jgi:hypothetical protein
MTCKSGRNLTLFVFNSNVVYCSIIFVNHIESATLKKVSLLSKLNATVYSLQLKSDSCQSHKLENNRLTPDSHQTETPPDYTISTIIAFFAFAAIRIATVKTLHIFRIARTA